LSHSYELQEIRKTLTNYFFYRVLNGVKMHKVELFESEKNKPFLLKKGKAAQVEGTT
jgi:hypothetical protein